MREKLCGIDTAFCGPFGSGRPYIGILGEFDADIAETVMEKTHDLTEPLNDFLMPYYSGTGFTAGSTDVGDVSWLTPAA